MLKKLLINALLILATLGFAGAAFASSLPVGGQTYYLAGAGVTTSQTTVQLTSFKTADGTLLTMSNFGTIGYGTLESQTPAKVEFISFTGVTQNANGTATLTGVVRGVGFVYPYASTLSLEHSHAGGASFIISNTPEFYYNEFAMQNNSNVFTYPTASSSPATKGYVDATAFSGSGAIAATTIALGYVQLATGAQAAAHTSLGSTGASLALNGAIASSTSLVNGIPVTNSSGFLDPSFVASSTIFSVTGPAILSASTTVNGIPALNIGKNVTVLTSTGTSTFAVPSGITKLSVQICGAGAGGQGIVGVGPTTGGGSGGYSFKVVDTSATSTIQYFIGIGGTGGTSGTFGTIGTWTTFGTNGFYMIANPGSGTTGGTASGGLLNITGNTGQVNYQGASTAESGYGASSTLGGSSYCNGGNGTSQGTGINGGNGLIIVTY